MVFVSQNTYQSFTDNLLRKLTRIFSIIKKADKDSLISDNSIKTFFKLIMHEYIILLLVIAVFTVIIVLSRIVCIAQKYKIGLCQCKDPTVPII